MASESSLHVHNDQSTMQSDLNREAALNASELELMWTSTIWKFFYDFHDHMLYYLEDLEPAVLLSALGTL